jgi:NAD-dependent SIR2 family protein deacetylase
MSKNKVTSCESCESEFSIVYDLGCVTEHDSIVCPFCRELIEPDVIEKEDEYEEYNEEFLSD